MGASMPPPGAVTNREFVRCLGRVLGRPAVLPAPAVALRVLLGEMADEAVLASARVVPRRLLERGFRFRFPGLEPALRHVLA
jgi:NAD dependent epimerase/dehydratase family enzyme